MIRVAEGDVQDSKTLLPFPTYPATWNIACSLGMRSEASGWTVGEFDPDYSLNKASEERIHHSNGVERKEGITP